MATTIPQRELRNDVSAVLRRVEAGEEFVVTVSGRPVAELRPAPPPRTTPRPFGLAAGEFTVPDDFDAPLPEETLRDFEGR